MFHNSESQWVSAPFLLACWAGAAMLAHIAILRLRQQFEQRLPPEIRCQRITRSARPVAQDDLIGRRWP